jgi:hypothetical protein
MTEQVHGIKGEVSLASRIAQKKHTSQRHHESFL